MAELLGVETEHVIIGQTVPDNLELSVSCEEDREKVLGVIYPLLSLSFSHFFFALSLLLSPSALSFGLDSTAIRS